jgi:hypothetical protein
MLGLNEENVGRMGDGGVQQREGPGRGGTDTNVRPIHQTITHQGATPYVRPARNLYTVSPVTTQQEGCLLRLYVNVPRLHRDLRHEPRIAGI